MKANSIKTSENKLYLVANNDLFESTNNGVNWSLKSRGVSYKYLVDSGKVFDVLCERGIKPIYTPQFIGNPKYLYSLNYYQISMNGTRVLINSDTITYNILNTFTINDIKKNNENIYVVGNNNLISKSNNNGNNIIVLSLFNTSFYRYNYVNNNVLSSNGGNWNL